MWNVWYMWILVERRFPEGQKGGLGTKKCGPTSVLDSISRSMSKGGSAPGGSSSLPLKLLLCLVDW